MKDQIVLALSTFPSTEVAERIARALVDEKLAACVNLLPGVRSIYSWQGKREETAEVLALIKTTPDTFPRMADRVLQMHPYEVPEIIALDVRDGLENYLRWVASNSS